MSNSDSQRCEGTTLSGERCEHMTRSGKYCWQHNKQSKEDTRRKKQQFLEAYSNNVTSVEAAAQRAGVKAWLVYQWRHRDPEFEQDYERAQEKQDELRARKLEDSALQQAASGDCSASLIIYLLKVYGGRKFRTADQRVVEEREKPADPALRDLIEQRKEELEEVNEQAGADNVTIADGVENAAECSTD